MKRPFRPGIDSPADRQSFLHATEAALAKAVMDAQAFEFAMLAYFIDMALAEVRSQQRQQAFRPGNPGTPVGGPSRRGRWRRAIAFWPP